MNLKSFWRGLFTGFTAGDGELERIREVGEADGAVLADAYVAGFRTGVARVLNRGRQCLLGLEEETPGPVVTVPARSRRERTAH